MSESMQVLEVRLKQLLDRMDELEVENKSIRSLASQRPDKLSPAEQAGQAEKINRLESLRLEKQKLEQKLTQVERSLDRIIEQLDKLEL